MAIFDQPTINQVQQANDIVDVISEHVSLKRKGREMAGVCPFHDDHRPSMYVNAEKQIFKCFACGAGGSVFTFVQMRENLSFPQAIERLAQRAGIKLEKKYRPASGSAKPENFDVDPNQVARLNAWAAKHFQRNLFDKDKGKLTREYIEQRQIPLEDAKKWQLGLALSNNELSKDAKKQNIPADLLTKSGLVTGHGQDKFTNRLMFPITDVTGRVIGFGGRTLGNAGAKYMNSPTTVLFDKSNSIYGLEQARHKIVSADLAVVVEGYTDVIMAHSKGCDNVVATLGTSFTEGHGRILRRYAKKVVLVFDADAAGKAAADRALDIGLSQKIDIKLASVPQGKDPCDFLLESGKEAFQKLIDEAVDVFTYKWAELKKRFEADDTISGKKTAVDNFLQTIATSLHTGNIAIIERGLIVNQLSNIVGLDSKKINGELNKKIAKIDRAGFRDESRENTQNGIDRNLYATAQREVLEVLLNEPGHFEIVQDSNITVGHFDVPILNEIASVLFKSLSAKANMSFTEILAQVESQQTAACIAELAQIGQEKKNFQARLADALGVMRRIAAQKMVIAIESAQEQREFLKSVLQNNEKQNPHNVGMI